jgi:hypothetical protein
MYVFLLWGGMTEAYTVLTEKNTLLMMMMKTSQQFCDSSESIFKLICTSHDLSPSPNFRKKDHYLIKS